MKPAAGFWFIPASFFLPAAVAPASTPDGPALPPPPPPHPPPNAQAAWGVSNHAAFATAASNWAVQRATYDECTAELARLRDQPRCAWRENAVRDNLARAKKTAAEAWKAFTLAAKEAICVTITTAASSHDDRPLGGDAQAQA